MIRRRQIQSIFTGATALLLAAVGAQTGARTPQTSATGESAALFQSKVAPLLQAKCLSCHSGKKPSGGLDFTTEASATKGGTNGAAWLAGDAEKSRMVQRITSRQMPPGMPLSPAEIESVRRWILGGAIWRGDLHAPAAPSKEKNRAGLDWWSLQKPRLPAIPKVKNSTWVRNPIDAFVLVRLEAQGLRPAPPASRLTLIRRATFDLLGVPPTPQEIDRFLKDTRPGAYEELIDHLLGDPRYGERWGRHWLDVARYAESQGFERDVIREHAWRYRDYVIDSLNKDKPYTQFIREQIAGDVLPQQTAEGVIATGFLVAGPYDEVGNTAVNPILRAQVREEELEDMLSTVGQTFLGLTVNCARCHDHKFDPISQRDYYRLKSVFDGVRPGNRSFATPDMRKQQDADAARLHLEAARLTREISLLEHGGIAPIWKVAGVPAPCARWSFAQDAQDEIGSLHGILHGGAKVEEGRLRLNGKGAYMETPPLARELRAKTLEAWVVLSNREQQGGGILSVQSPDGKEFDALVYGERQAKKWTAGSDNFTRTKDLDGPLEDSPPGQMIHAAVVYGTDNRITVYHNGVLYGQAYQPQGEHGALRTFGAGKAQVLLGLRHLGAGSGFLEGDIVEARLYDCALTPEQVAASYRAGVSKTGPVSPLPLSPEAEAKRKSLLASRERLNVLLHALEQPQLTYAANPQKPEPTFLLVRGDVQTHGEQVTAGGLSSLRSLNADFGLPADGPEGERRVRLADWIANPDNPLTARVLVNRVWHYHFGRGIVGTPNDFGFNGEKPTHPELLDWLASVFMQEKKQARPGTETDGMLHATKHTRHKSASSADTPISNACGWRLKSLHRLIMLSNTYRQSSEFSPRAAAQDADNRLLWRFAPQRLEGEVVRDSMLCASGQIQWKRGGPSFRPFTETVNNSHFYTLFDSDAPEFNRRTIYRINVNSAKSTLLDTLDCPDPSTKTPRRSITTTPLQALELMNNRFVLQQSRFFAQRVRKESGSNRNSQVQAAYRLSLGRLPTQAELARAAALIQSSSLDTLCWALFNSSEFLYVQ